jgi:hypothetical protein
VSALKLFEKTNTKGSYVLAAWHHPKAITWKWALYWQWSWRLHFHHWNGGNGYGHAYLSIPLVGWFSFNWQPVYWWKETP